MRAFLAGDDPTVHLACPRCADTLSNIPKSNRPPGPFRPRRDRGDFPGIGTGSHSETDARSTRRSQGGIHSSSYSLDMFHLSLAVMESESK